MMRTGSYSFLKDCSLEHRARHGAGLGCDSPCCRPAGMAGLLPLREVTLSLDIIKTCKLPNLRPF